MIVDPTGQETLQRFNYVPVDPRLGRQVVHDPRSREFAVGTVRGVIPTTDVRHRRHGAKLDQGSVGACVGFTGAHCLNTDPFRASFVGKPFLKNSDALRFYSKATVLDRIPGKYPPNDTGTSGLYVCKAMLAEGLIKRYEWAFGFQHGLEAISFSPLMQGTEWRERMMVPNGAGEVFPAGNMYGGHEYLWIGVEIRSKVAPSTNRSWFLNSWGSSWGVNGYFFMTWKNHEKLLSWNGDLIRPII